MGNFEKFNNQEQAQAEMILNDFDLNIEDLQGKTVLDIGAGEANLAKHANKHRSRVVSLEANIEEVKKENPNLETKGANYVEAQAQNMPLKKESFDLLLSYGGPPNITSTKEEILEVLREGDRVLKKEGEWRIGRGTLNAGAFSGDFEEDFDSLNTKKRVERIQKTSLDFLKDNWEGDVQEIRDEDPEEIKYYILRKS